MREYWEKSCENSERIVREVRHPVYIYICKCVVWRNTFFVLRRNKNLCGNILKRHMGTRLLLSDWLIIWNPIENLWSNFTKKFLSYNLERNVILFLWAQAKHGLLLQHKAMQSCPHRLLIPELYQCHRCIYYLSFQLSKEISNS